MMRKQIIFVITLLMATWAVAQDVKVTHNLPASAAAGETIDAQFTVNKGNIGAFAKFQCDVPAGTQAVAGDTKSGNFTFENNRIKIVWVSLPGDATFTFNVKITLSSAGGDQKFTGQFFYLENNVKKEFDIPPHTIAVAGGGGVTTTSTPTTTPTETTSTTSTPNTTPTETTSTTSTPTTTPTETTSTTSTPTTTTTQSVTTTTTPTTTTTAPTRTNVVFYVQIAALSTDPGLMYKKYGKMKVVIENGLYKVLIGTFNTIEDARKRKAELISQGLQGSFVVGYENGVRIKL